MEYNILCQEEDPNILFWEYVRLSSGDDHRSLLRSIFLLVKRKPLHAKSDFYTKDNMFAVGFKLEQTSVTCQVTKSTGQPSIPLPYVYENTSYDTRQVSFMENKCIRASVHSWNKIYFARRKIPASHFVEFIHWHQTLITLACLLLLFPNVKSKPLHVKSDISTRENSFGVSFKLGKYQQPTRAHRTHGSQSALVR